MCDTEVTCPSGRSHVHVPCGGFAHLLAAQLSDFVLYSLKNAGRESTSVRVKLKYIIDNSLILSYESVKNRAPAAVQVCILLHPGITRYLITGFIDHS